MDTTSDTTNAMPCGCRMWMGKPGVSQSLGCQGHEDETEEGQG